MSTVTTVKRMITTIHMTSTTIIGLPSTEEMKQGSNYVSLVHIKYIYQSKLVQMSIVAPKWVRLLAPSGKKKFGDYFSDQTHSNFSE